MKQLVKGFNFNGKDYQIFAIQNDEEISFKVFQGDAPANGLSYTLNKLDVHDIFAVTGTNLVSEMLGKAEDDVRNQVWENYVSIVNKMENKQ